MSSNHRKRKKPGAMQWLESALPRNSVRRVAVVFVLLLGASLAFLTLAHDWSGWQTVTGVTASAGGNSARFFGVNATVSGNLILLPSRSLSVDRQCTAVTLLALYIALVLAYPVSWRMRFLAIAIGTPVLFIANIARLVGVAWASELLTDKPFYLVHDYLFESGMVFVVMMMWVVWLSVASRRT
jgi:exosortase/archaeosortase family protein